MRYKNISVTKLSDHGEVDSKLPTHRLVVADSDFKNKQPVGSFWTKESDHGKFLAGVMANEREYKNKEGTMVKVFAYSIVRDDYLDELEAIAEKYKNKSFTPSIASKTVDEKGEDTPF